MVKAKPFTLRLTTQTDHWVAQEARRTRRSKGAIVENLAEEAARMRRFPGIGFRGPDYDRQAWVMSTAFDVWEVIQAFQDCDRSIRKMLEVGDLSEAEIRLALAYYEEYPEEIDSAIADNNLSQEELHRLYPTFVPQP